MTKKPALPAPAKGAAAAAVGLSGFIPWNDKAEAFAHHLHASFLAIHLNEFPESLFESEIFGHRKGAFTGAVDNYEGALSRCRQHASVFFDEIGEATLPVRVKLLQGAAAARVHARGQPRGACARDERRAHARDQALAQALAQGALTAAQLVQRYCAALYARHESFVESRAHHRPRPEHGEEVCRYAAGALKRLRAVAPHATG